MLRRRPCAEAAAFQLPEKQRLSTMAHGKRPPAERSLSAQLVGSIMVPATFPVGLADCSGRREPIVSGAMAFLQFRCLGAYCGRNHIAQLVLAVCILLLAAQCKAKRGPSI